MKRLVPIFGLLVISAITVFVFYPQWHQKHLNKSLLEATASNNVDEVKRLIQDGADVNSHIDLNWTPLMQASFNGNAEVVQILVDKGAKLEPKQPTGNSALYEAAMQGRPECVKILLAKGANPNVRTRFQSALGAAESMRRVRMTSSQPLRHPTIAEMDEVIAMMTHAGAK